MVVVVGWCCRSHISKTAPQYAFDVCCKYFIFSSRYFFLHKLSMFSLFRPLFYTYWKYFTNFSLNTIIFCTVNLNGGVATSVMCFFFSLADASAAAAAVVVVTKYINHEHRWAHLLDIKINRHFVCSSIANKTISMKTKTAHKMIGSLMWLPFCIFAYAIFFSWIFGIKG